MDAFYMPGTQKTGQYIVVANSKRGRVGYRLLGNGSVRVRIEPTNLQSAKRLAAVFTRGEGWKQPGDQGEKRFSQTFTSHREVVEAIELAMRQLSFFVLFGLQVNPQYRRRWRQPIYAHFFGPLTGLKVVDDVGNGEFDQQIA